MGCDIHIAVELRLTQLDYWPGHRQAAVSSISPRDYRLFGLMAGVREEKLKLFEPRGYPPDSDFVNEAAEEELLGEVQHNRSWLSRAEFAQVVEKYERLPERNHSTVAALHCLQGMMAPALEARVVFGFDN